MFIKNISSCDYFKALDGTKICEFLHPKNEKGVNIGFSIAHAFLKPGESSHPHKLKKSTEIYYILKGTGFMHIDDENAEVKPDDVIYIPPNSVQWIENTGKSSLSFLCMVCPPWQAEDEKLV